MKGDGQGINDNPMQGQKKKEGKGNKYNGNVEIKRRQYSRRHVCS